MRRILCLIALSLAACAPQPVDVAATVAAGVALTDTASAPTATPTSTPAPEPTATSTRPPSPTPAPTASPTLLPNARNLSYGEKNSHGPRQEIWIYAFEGTEGDDVTVSVVLSNAHPNTFQCRTFSAAASYLVKTNMGQAMKPRSHGDVALQEIYRLPYSGVYYIEVRCSGPDCNGYCAQVDTSLQLNR